MFVVQNCKCKQLGYIQVLLWGPFISHSCARSFFKLGFHHLNRACKQVAFATFAGEHSGHVMARYSEYFSRILTGFITDVGNPRSTPRDEY